MSEEISSRQNLAEIIYHACDASRINLFNTEEEEADVICIYSTNETNDIYMNNYGISTNNIYHYYHQRSMKMYLKKQNMIQKNKEFIVRNTSFLIYY